MLLQQEGYIVNKMMLFCAAYDVKYGRGKPLGVFKIPFVDDNVIIEKASAKIKDLKFFSEMYPEILPDKCEETWGGQRCTTYCSVNFACPHFSK
jgi:hypothetical protein